MSTKNETKAPETIVEPKATEEPKAQEVKDEREDIYIPKGYANDEPNLFVSVNGVNYLLPKGKTSKVPKHVAAEIRRSQKAQEALDKHIDEMLEASK